MGMFTFLAVISLLTLSKAAPQATSSSGCVGTISSLSDVSAAVQCKTININGFNVPAGQTFSLNLMEGTTVNVLGKIRFEPTPWQGPLFYVNGKDIKFNGNGQVWDGDGPSHWDGPTGTSIKPSPMMLIQMSGTFSNVHVVNSPSRGIGVINNDPIVISDVVVDNSQGNFPNELSNGLPAGHNTDGFDISASNVVIRNSNVTNQDDCLAINSGKNILFEYNHCTGGHGISIGSISSNTVVEDVVIQGNMVVDSTEALRIKTDQTASNSRVSRVTYSGNTAINCASYGVLITQSYPQTIGNPGNGVIISDVNIVSPPNHIEVSNGANTVALNCGVGTCTGTWDWSGLITSGGMLGPIKNPPSIIGYTL